MSLSLHSGIRITFSKVFTINMSDSVNYKLPGDEQLKMSFFNSLSYLQRFKCQTQIGK